MKYLYEKRKMKKMWKLLKSNNNIIDIENKAETRFC